PTTANRSAWLSTFKSTITCGDGSPADYSLLSQHQGQAVLGIANNHDLSVLAVGEFLSRLNAFPGQQLLADARSHRLLEVADALGLNALAVGFLLFFLQAEGHG